jgi:hypothetical protein
VSDWSGFDLDVRILMGLGIRAFDDGDMKTSYRYFSKALDKEPIPKRRSPVWREGWPSPLTTNMSMKVWLGPT